MKKLHDPPRLLLCGAGMTGRGHVAQLAHEDGWQLTLVDRDPDLVRTLRSAGRYTVRLISAQPREVAIGGFQVLHVAQKEELAQELATAALVVTAVRPNNLPDLAATLAEGLRGAVAAGRTAPLNIVAAENMNDSSQTLWRWMQIHLNDDEKSRFSQQFGFPNSMIARVVPVAEDPLFLPAEDYNEWTADVTACVGDPPSLVGLEWVPNQTARLQRKLYLHNTGHATCAYLGFLRGYAFIHEAARDPWVRDQVRAAMTDSGRAVAAEFEFSEEEIRAYVENLLERLPADALPDGLDRVVREPIRKLGPEERFLGPLALCQKYGLPREGLCRGIAAALAAELPEDPEGKRLADLVKAHGPLGALQEVAGTVLDPQSAQAIQEAIHGLR